MNKISFAEDSLDLYDSLMPELRNNCFMYDELLLDFAMTLGCPWYNMCFYRTVKANPATRTNINLFFR